MSEMPKSSEVTVTSMTDEVVAQPPESKPTIEERRAQYDAEARTKLAGRLPSGYGNAVIRCDDEPKDTKTPVISPETASRLLGAISDLSERAGLTRPDAEPDPVEPKDKDKDEGNPKKDENDEEGETGLAKLTRMAEGLSQMLMTMNERLDAIEGNGKRKDADKDEPEPVAADSQLDFEPKSEVYFAEAQSRADKAFSAFGGSAPPPMSGERLMSYRRRLLRPLMSHSDTFKDLDLAVASVDRKLFDKVEDVVHRESIAASKNNALVPHGYLQERKENRNGHIHTTFYGSPMTWMSRFMPGGRAVTKINTRPPTEPARW